MFHSSHIHVPRSRQPGALRTFVTSSSFGPPEGKEPLRRAILFSTVAMVLLLIGSVLTWLGFNDVFGGRVSMTGPLLIALALLLLLLSMRQFMIARKRNNHNRNNVQLGSVNPGTLTTVVVDRNDGVGAVTVIMDSVNVDQSPQTRLYADDYAPPSYSDVTCWHGDEPPPPYEDAVQGQHPPGVLPGYQEQDSAPTAAQTFTDSSVTHSSSFHNTAPSDHAPACCHGDHRSSCPCCQSAGTDQQQTSPTIGGGVLPPVSSQDWSATDQFYLIPQMLGLMPSPQKQHRIGEVPPAYQALSLRGRPPPMAYTQAVAVSSNPDTGQRSESSKEETSGGGDSVDKSEQPVREKTEAKLVDSVLSEDGETTSCSDQCRVERLDVAANVGLNVAGSSSVVPVIDELENL